jgi:hypothetical protein
MGVLKPSGNELHLLPHQQDPHPSPPTDMPTSVNPRVALTEYCDPIPWHRRFGHLNMQSLYAPHTYIVPNTPALASSIKNVSCDSCLLQKATAAPRNIIACTKPSRPLMNLASDTWGPVNVPSPHGLRYCMLVIDHHTHFIWVRFLKSKDDTCSKLECILLEIRHLHARHHSSFGTFAPCH